MKRVKVTTNKAGQRTVNVAPEAVGYGWKGDKVMITALKRRGETPEDARMRVGKAHGIQIKPFDEETIFGQQLLEDGVDADAETSVVYDFG